MKKASEKAASKLTKEEFTEDEVHKFVEGAEKSKEEIEEVDKLDEERKKVATRKIDEERKRKEKDEKTRYFKAISMRFTKDEIDLLDELKQKKGIPRLAIIRIAISELAERELDT
ncbi:hypothetical protein BJAS_P4062 [Bathymodiolus japonicus methanotrophic gill symbiont]|uniref:hypothetical protein n=1 Tax=Bathymodiolus japonicus methanotrophic gill symbiont TaxID=113269 RepID=UPI001B575D30|nr:hypothetical protein [Bathymodiolus japonicus methanotrophic gill symbiont]GFO73317.1 hypothetical protein BJAS_P4062 [Bathymodiolus japonicus methanotrophic gill symbiont]